MSEVPVLCIGCGCDEQHACIGGCSWLRVDEAEGLGVCSSCPDAVSDFDAGVRFLSDEAEEAVAERQREELEDLDEPGLLLPGDDEYDATLAHLSGGRR